MLVVLAIVGILMAMGILSLQRLSNPASNAARQISTTLMQVRTSAVSNTLAYRVSVVSNALVIESALHCNDTTGWTTQRNTTELPTGLTLTPSSTPFACFSSRGLAPTSGNVLLRDSKNRTFRIQVFAGGAIRVIANAS
ncbi:hypothetical protein MF271_18145 (plasmid) [Deinococcus sp. KNUC1210]|nr:hypothetical protein MF271_18145 [Deinococcus sp. KNUC1210]